MERWRAASQGAWGEVIAVIALVYIACGVMAYGITFADMQGRYQSIKVESYRTDMSFAVFVGLWGPLGLVVSLFLSGFAEYGVKFK